MVDPTLVADDGWVRVLGALTSLGRAALAVLVLIVLMRLAMRERLAWQASALVPADRRREVRRAARRTPVLRRTEEPTDPFTLSTPVVVQPMGDGRPGWGVMAPGPPRHPPADLAPDGSRQDAVVPLGRSTHVLVVCLGRVGSPRPEQGDGPDVIEPAEVRARRFHAAPAQGLEAVGPVDPAPTGLGAGWRATVAFAGGRQMLTDTHVDHEGWAFVVGVLSKSHHTQAVEALDRLLATWRWLPARPAPVDTPPW